MGWEIDSSIIYNTTKLITEYRVDRKGNFNFLLKSIANVLAQWTGETYVGEVKEKGVQSAFQRFFVEIFCLACELENKDFPTEAESEFVKCARYQGDIYRYIGSDSPCRKCEGVEYNEIYVSWSKEKGNSYIMGKLYPPIYFMHAKLSGKFYGFDIKRFDRLYSQIYSKQSNIAKGAEREVVFPTLKEVIVNIQEVINDDET